jgi:toxin ParE1/3/4
MTFRVRVVRRAQSDLVEIRDYLRLDAPELAERVVETLLQAIESLEHSPLRGARPRDARLRRLGYRFLSKSSWLVFYKVDEAKSLVRVHRVLHARREYHAIL